MYILWDIIVIYKNGAKITVDNIVTIEIDRGDWKWRCAPWAKTRFFLVNTNEVEAVYKTARRIWNPFKMIWIMVHKND